VVPRLEGVLGQIHQREVHASGDLAAGGQLGQDGLGEEVRGPDLALVEGNIAAALPELPLERPILPD